MRKLFKERKLFKGGNYMRKYGSYKFPLDLELHHFLFSMHQDCKNLLKHSAF